MGDPLDRWRALVVDADPHHRQSPHGPTQLADGRLLYLGKELWTGEKRNGASESLDDGQTWRWLPKSRRGPAIPR